MDSRTGVVSGKSSSINRFWQIMGPHIASRAVFKELNDYIFDDDQTVWFVAYSKGTRDVPSKNDVIAFCCAKISDSKCALRYDWVNPEYRTKQDWIAFLFDIRQRYLLKEYPDKPHEVVTGSQPLVEKLKKEAFKSFGKRGSFTKFRKEF
jgi:hypothetical protein